MPAAQTDLPNLTNIVNPSVAAHQAPTVNVRTGNVEPPNPPLPPCVEGVDPRTGNMLRAERDGGAGHPCSDVSFPNPPSTTTDAGKPYQIPASNV